MFGWFKRNIIKADPRRLIKVGEIIPDVHDPFMKNAASKGEDMFRVFMLFAQSHIVCVDQKWIKIKLNNTPIILKYNKSSKSYIIVGQTTKGEVILQKEHVTLIITNPAGTASCLYNASSHQGHQINKHLFIC